MLNMRFKPNFCFFSNMLAQYVGQYEIYDNMGFFINE